MALKINVFPGGMVLVRNFKVTDPQRFCMLRHETLKTKTATFSLCLKNAQDPILQDKMLLLAIEFH